MKKVLSLLVAFVLLQVQTWALSGGPVYGGSQAAVTGTYAGVFTGVGGTAIDLTGTGLVDASGTNALGLFVLGVPATDLAVGTFGLFFQGIFFQGGMLGIVDPNKQTLSAVAQGIHVTQLSSSTFFGQSFTSVNFDSTADGTIKAKLGIGGATVTGATASITLVGTGAFTVSKIVTTTVTIPDPNRPGFFINVPVQNSVPQGTLTFKVDGFKQSATVVKPAADSIANLLNGQGAGNGT